ncbi:MAG TPA: class I SAM-dependent methyltransferase [Bryobacteraceae bacterium]|nr:class I SAM-dependent methyltransferase [Bryobacteraceae bacterium]
MTVTAAQGYEIWSERYDADPNPLLALETRVLLPRLGNLAQKTVIDAATGTGRWMSIASAMDANALGLDFSPAMLAIAARKPALRARLIQGDLRALPFRSAFADLAICSFALSYLPFASGAFSELARVSRRVIVSDMHPSAMLKGWKRSFRSGGKSWSIDHYYHRRADLERTAHAAGMKLAWTIEAAFDLPELSQFVAAGKRHLFDEAARTPALFAACWTRNECD